MRKVLLALCSIASVSHAQTFQNPRLLPTPHAVNNVLHGDLNGDGFDDLIYDDFSVTPSTLNVMLGDGHGGFTPSFTISLPANTSDGCLLSNFSGSGHFDIACVVQSVSLSTGINTSSVVFFTGNGDGTFASAKTIANPYQQYSGLTLVNAGDINGDGAADLILQQSSANSGYPVLSDGHGGWSIGKLQNYYAIPIFAGDLNGDGKVDWVFAGPSVALGNGDGTFGAPQSFFSLGFPNSGCAFGDLDGDTHIDAVCAYADTTTGDIDGLWSLRFFHGNSDGTFTYLPADSIIFGDGSHESEDFGSWASPRYIVDLNGDGVPDILGVSADGLTAYYGTGLYQFGPPVHFAAGVLGSGFSGSFVNWQLMDINGDHLPDIVSGSFNGLLVTLGKSGSTFAAASAYEVNGVVGYVAVADFNGDGVPDIVSTGDFHMAISLGRGDGTFLPYKNLDTGPVHWEGLYLHPDDTLLMHGDFNGDGKQDLIAVGSSVSGSFTENYYYLQGNGDGTFQTPVSMYSAGFYASSYGLSIVADLNGDRRDDLIGKPDLTSGQITATISQGNGTFTPVVSTAPLEPIPNSGTNNFSEPFPGVADFDGDGKPDIIVAAHSNAYFLHGNGDGTFSKPVAIAIPPRPNAGATDSAVSVIAGDFDGDGYKDFAVLWGQVTYGVYINGPVAYEEIVVFYGNGDGTFSTPVVAAYPTADYAYLVAADLGHNGRDAIVGYGSGTLNGGSGVGVLRGAANRTFGSITPLVAGNGLANLQIADLNGDGLPDLVFSNEDYNVPANSATVLLNLGSAPVVTGVVVATPEPSYAGSNFTVTATFSTPDGSLITGPATFSIDGVSIGSGALANNSASISVPGTYSIGVHILSAAWAANTTFAPATLIGTHSVVANPTATTLTSSSNPSLFNQPVTFTAQVTTSNGQTPDGTVTFFAGAAPINAPVVINSSPAGTLSASITTSSLPAGSTQIAASYVTGTNSIYAASSAALTQQVLTGYPSVTTLASSLNPSMIFQSATFSAHVAAQTAINGTPAGSVTFSDGSTSLGTQPIDPFGNATLTTSTLTAGTHPIAATYLPTNSFTSSSASLTQTINAAHTAAILTVSPITSTFGTQVVLTASINTTIAIPPAITGTVTFCNTVVVLGQNVCTGTVLGTISLNAAGIATLPLTALSAGSYTFGCMYSGDPVHAPSFCNSVTATVNAAPTALTLASSANPSTALTPITFTATLTALGKPISPQSLIFTFNGKALPPVTTNASGSASVIVTMPAGAQAVAVTFAASINYTGSSAQLTETVTPTPTTTTLLAAPNPVYQNQPLTLTATISAQSGTATPDGTVTFFDGMLPLGRVSLPAFAYTGTVSTATFTTNTLSVGNHTLSASYTPVTAPSNSFIASTSPAITVTGLPQTYTLTIADPTLTIQTEHHKTTTVTLTSIGGFTGQISIACGTLPEYASCFWDHTVLTLPANGAVSTQLDIDTDAVRGFKSSLPFEPFLWRTSGEVAFALLTPILLVRRRRRFGALLSLVFVVTVGFAITGCGDKYPGHTAPGTYGIAINASGTTIGAISPTTQSAQLTLVVTPE